MASLGGVRGPFRTKNLQTSQKQTWERFRFLFLKKVETYLQNLFPYTEKYTEYEYEIQNNNSLYKLPPDANIFTNTQSLFGENKIYENTGTNCFFLFEKDFRFVIRINYIIHNLSLLYIL